MTTQECKLRSFQLVLQRAELDVAKRTVPMSVSSDTADILTYVDGKGVGYLILDHSSLASIDLTRFQGDNGGPLLFNHDRSQIIGRFKPTGIQDGKLSGVARFGNGAKAAEVFQDVQDEILTDTSVYFNYDPDDVVVDMKAAIHDDFPTYRAMKWSLTESSLVPVPGDTKTGVGRNTTSSSPVAEQPAPTSPTPPPAVPAGTPRGESMPTPEEITAAAQAAETLRAANQGLTTQVLQLRAIAEAHGKGQQASEILAAKPLENARAEIMALLATTPVSVPRSLEDMGASDAERKNFSYARLLSASVSLQEGKRDANCLELEVSSAIAKTMPGTYKQRGGVFVPFQINARAAMDTQTPTAGKELVYTQPAELIEILRSKLIAAKMGARFLTGLQGPMGFSKQTGQAIAHWITENSGADAAESEPVTGILTLSPKTLIGGAQFSRQLLETGTWSVEQMIRADLAYSHAAAFDLAAFHGTGVGQPTGIYNLAGVNAVAMGGVSPTYQELLTMITDIAGANGLLDSMGWVTNPIVAGNLMGKLEFAVNGAKTIWTGNVEEGVMAGYKAAASNLVRKDLGVGTNEHGMAIGSWSQVIIGCFGGGFEIITDPFKYKLQGLIDVATFEMGDVLVRHPESFTKATGLIPS